MDNTVPSGFTPEPENNILKELKNINDTLLTIVKNLNVTTNSNVFTDSSYFERTFDKYSARSDKAHEETVSKSSSRIEDTFEGTKESLNKIQDLIKNYEKYAEGNSEFQNISKEKLESFLELQKKQNFIQEKLLTASKSQEGIINSIYKDYTKQAQEKLDDIRKRRITSGSIQPEEREINKAKYRAGLKMIPEGINQAFMNTKDSSTVGTLFSGIGGLVKELNASQGGRSLDQYKEAVSERKQEAEKVALKDLNLYKYNINKPDETKELVDRKADVKQKEEFTQAERIKERLEPAKEKLDSYTNTFFKPNEKQTINSAEINRKVEAREGSSKYSDILDYIRNKDSTKKQPVDHESIMAQLRAIDPSKKPPINVIPDVKKAEISIPTVEVKASPTNKETSDTSIKYNKKEPFPTIEELKKGLSLDSGETPKEYPVNNISPQQVKSVLGTHGIGYLYLGEVLKDNLGKDKKDLDKEKKEGGFDLDEGLMGGMIAKLLGSTALTTAITTAMGTIIPALIAGGLMITLVKHIMDGSTLTDADGNETTLSELQTKANKMFAEQKASDPTLQYHLGGGAASNPTFESTKPNEIYVKKWENIKRIAGSDPESEAASLYKMILENTKPGSAYENRPEDYMVHLIQSESRYMPGKEKTNTNLLNKFHKGGIIGQKEILAQKGEVILPVDDSQYGLDSGILKKTENGGVSINKNINNENIQNNNMNTQNMERLLQELLSVVSTNLIGAIKENKPEQSKSMVVPQINLNTLSYRG